jgi:hypothetical protein
MMNVSAHADFVQDTFNLCSRPNTTDDINNVINWVNNGLGTMAMVNYPYPTDFVATLPGNPVNYTCNVTTQFTDPTTPNDYMMALARANSVFNNYTGKEACQNFNTTNT